MSLLIKGMEMPWEEAEPLRIELYADGTVIVIKEQDDFYEFKAVPVPSHGRLIDADKLMKKLRGIGLRLFASEDLSKNQTLFAMAYYLKEAPTIISAEEET